MMKVLSPKLIAIAVATISLHEILLGHQSTGEGDSFFMLGIVRVFQGPRRRAVVIPAHHGTSSAPVAISSSFGGNSNAPTSGAAIAKGKSTELFAKKIFVCFGK